MCIYRLGPCAFPWVPIEGQVGEKETYHEEFGGALAPILRQARKAFEPKMSSVGQTVDTEKR